MSLFFSFLALPVVSVLVWVTITIERAFLVLSASPGQAVKSTGAAVVSALLNMLSPLQALEGSESSVPARRYDEGKISRK